MLQKINQVHGKGDIYIPPKNDHETEFGIQHFAGVVHYDSKGTIKASSLSCASPLQCSYCVCLSFEASSRKTVTPSAQI